jgi:thioredoxin-related protein
MRWAKLLSWTMIFSAVSMFSVPLAADEPAKLPWLHDVNAAWQETQTSRRPMLLFITTQGCTYCRLMERDTFSDGEVIAQIGQAFVPITIDAADQAAFVKKLGIRLYPTTVIIGPNSKVLDSISGYMKPQQLRTRLLAVSYQE